MEEKSIKQKNEVTLVTSKDHGYFELIDQELNKLFPKRKVERILFVAPPDGDKSMFDYATGKRGRYWNYPAYGAGVIASYLREDGIEVSILNLNNKILDTCWNSKSQNDFDFDLVWKKSLKKELQRVKPDMVGVTCMFTQTHTATVEVCREVKLLIPDVPLSLGGVHITNSFINWEQSKSILNDFFYVDLFFLYEAELAFQQNEKDLNKYYENIQKYK